MAKLNTTTSGIITSVLTADSSPALELQENGVTFRTLGQSQLVSGVAVTASGTYVEFPGIPSWAKRITVMFSGVSTNGTSIVQVQLGDSGGIETTGYSGATVRTGGTNVYTSAYSSGILTQTGMVAASTYVGQIVFTNVSGNSWVVSGMTANATSPTNDSCFMCGAKTLSSTLTQVRITTVNGTDAFDAGTVNIMWE